MVSLRTLRSTAGLASGPASARLRGADDQGPFGRGAVGLLRRGEC